MFASTPSRFPEFVADQVLTAQNLQDLFNYLDEQERMTRTNLIGIGIVCGLEVFVSSQGNALTITRGVGITSSGYLVAVEQRTYPYFWSYEAPLERLYDRFSDPATKTQRFDLWELAQKSTAEAQTELTADFLKDKVALLFVELFETNNKNCDPDSCDDKGATVTVNLRPLLVRETDARSLIGTTEESGGIRRQTCLSWPDLKMRRYNVPATTLPDSATILKNYLTLLTEPFIENVEKTLTQVYQSLRLVVAGDFSQNPFTGLKQKVAFLFNGSLGVAQLIHIQYYYDFFSDLIQAYEELRTVCGRQLALCCPDENLFPRHLLLGATFAAATDYRHRFLPSPAVAGSSEGIAHLRFLFGRLVQLVRTVRIPMTGILKKTPVIVTPSKLGDIPLSEKAIPYYYDVFQDPPLFEFWNYDKTEAGNEKTNLSYHAPAYNQTDEFVRLPLEYDLEPYNFFRIEGHIGQNWKTAFQEIYKIRQNNRLPFDVVALNGDFRSLLLFVRQNLNNLSKVLAVQPERWRQILCYFNDIEMQYDLQAAELRCTLGKVMRYLYDTTYSDFQGPDNEVPVSELVRLTDPGYRTRSATLGKQFNKWYPTVKNAPYLSWSASNNQLANNSFAPFLLLAYYLEKAHEALPDGIIKLNIEELTTRLRDAANAAETLLKLLEAQNNDGRNGPNASLILSLNAVIRVCKGSLLQELYRNFLFRFYLYMANQSFAMFSFLNGGIQHKAGVPVGGTFILVYHDALPQQLSTDNPFRLDVNVAFRSDKAFAAARKVDITTKTETEGIAETIFRSGQEFEKFTAVKDTGVYWLTKLLETRRTEDDLTDKELLELVGEIPDGAVIADFYLPYVCASECAPMSYLVLPDQDEPEKPRPTISIEPTRFCNVDRSEIKPVVSPEGGALTGEGTFQRADGTTAFMPSRVEVGAQASRKVTLTYTVESQSATVEVEVFAMPRADFTFNTTPTAARTVIFTPQTDFGQEFTWDFGDGSTSAEKSPAHTYQENKTFKVTLTVKNGPCTAKPISKEVTVAPPAPVDKCVSLQVWSDAFNKLNGRTDTLFASFRQQFPQYTDVAKAFTRFPDILGRPQKDQPEALSQVMPVGSLVEWLRTLNVLVLQTRETRPFALEIFRILTGIVTFYSCVPQEDINQARIPMLDVWGLITDAFVPQWRNVSQSFTADERKIIAQMLDSAKTENDRVRSTERTKQNYLNMLKRLIDILSNL